MKHYIKYLSLFCLLTTCQSNFAMFDFLSKLTSRLTTILSPAKTGWSTYLDYKQDRTNTPPNLTIEASRIYEAIFKALRNYKIDPSTVTVILRPKQETNDGGYCNSITRTICIDETLAENGKSDESLNYVVHHEIGHLADKGLQKVNEAHVKAGDQWSEDKELECLRQGELRADLLATKHLIDACQYTPIAYRLIALLEHIAEGKIRDDDTHPTCNTEYANIAKYLLDHNYKINFSYSGQSDSIQTIITITNNNLPTLKVTGRYSGKLKLVEPASPSLSGLSYFKFIKTIYTLSMKNTVRTRIMATGMTKDTSGLYSKNALTALAFSRNFIFRSNSQIKS